MRTAARARGRALALLLALAPGCGGDWPEDAELPDPAAPGEAPPGAPVTPPSSGPARVDVGPDQTLDRPGTLVTARAPAGGRLEGEWTVTAGPARYVFIADRRAAQTAVHFLVAGAYEITFALDGGAGRDSLVARVRAPSHTYAGRVLDDGRPATSAVVEIVWHRSGAVIEALRPGAADGGFQLAGVVAPADELGLRVRP